jgi:hypothetical protein
MRQVVSLFAIVLAASSVTVGSETQQNATTVAKTRGLIAFWDFSLMLDGKRTSYRDDEVVQHGPRHPVYSGVDS